MPSLHTELFCYEVNRIISRTEALQRRASSIYDSQRSSQYNQQLIKVRKVAIALFFIVVQKHTLEMSFP